MDSDPMLPVRLPKKRTNSREAIPEEYLSEFRYALLQIMIACTSDMEAGKTFKISDAVREAAIATHKFHRPVLPVSTLLYTYHGLYRAAANYYRDAALYVAPRMTFAGENSRTVWISEDAYQECALNKPNRSSYGSAKLYYNSFLISVQGLLR